MTGYLFDKGQMIADRYTVQERLGQGAFSQVYKVLDIHQNEIYALKILTSEEGQLEELRKEFRILKDLVHPNIVRFYDTGMIPEANYLKLEYVSSVPLKHLIKEQKISFSKAKEITKALLGALKYLSEKKIAHRDIKPSNILMSEDGPVFIDFNVSSIGKTSGSTMVGTLPYQPPEVLTEGWEIEGDLYSLGVVLFEMLTGVCPFKEHGKEVPPDPCSFKRSISASLAHFILRAIAYKREERFRSPEEMSSELEKVDWKPLKDLIPDSPLIDQIEISDEERKRPNHNPYLSRLLTLYSQSRYSNAGATGLNDLAKATYVETLLDRQLKPTILSGKYRLIIITGNAGDGKTAFIQNFEEQVAHDPETLSFTRAPSSNGAEFSYNGMKFYTNYDGSQDEGNIKNDEVLTRFFRPFMWDLPPKQSDSVHVIAINEGRLLDFVHEHRKEFTFLDDMLHGALEKGTRGESGILLVNLNLRSVIVESEDPSIFHQMVNAFIQPKLWEPCNKCDIRDHCYVKFNVDSLLDANYGPQIKERLQALVRIAHFRQRMHITVRNLRSALSYLLFGTVDCEAIHQSVADETLRAEYISNYYYNGWFKQGASFEKGIHFDQQQSDRLVSLLSDVDPGKVTNPILDAKLAFGPSPVEDHAWLFPTFDSRAGHDLVLLEKSFQEAQNVRQNTGVSKKERDASWKGQRAEINSAHMALRRKYFFERTDDAWTRMLPYRQYERFYQLVSDEKADKVRARDDLLRAITKSEGFQDPDIAAGDLVIRTSFERAVTIKSFRRFRKDDLTCNVKDIGDMKELIEFIPSSLLVRYKNEITLDIDIDLFEMLERILKGFRPSMNELRGSFIDLLIFKRQLSSERFDEVLLTQDERLFYRVNKIAIGSLKMGTLKGGM
jgi:serine/threonine protein kinase